MTFLTKDQILVRRDLPREVVPVPEWITPAIPEPCVLLQGLSAGEADSFVGSLQKTDGKRTIIDREHYCAQLLSRCIVNEQGERLLTAADVLLLSQQSAVPIQRLAGIAERLSGLQAQAVEQAAKN